MANLNKNPFLFGLLTAFAVSVVAWVFVFWSPTAFFFSFSKESAGAVAPQLWPAVLQEPSSSLCVLYPDGRRVLPDGSPCPVNEALRECRAAWAELCAGREQQCRDVQYLIFRMRLLTDGNERNGELKCENMAPRSRANCNKLQQNLREGNLTAVGTLLLNPQFKSDLLKILPADVVALAEGFGVDFIRNVIGKLPTDGCRECILFRRNCSQVGQS